MLEMTHRPTTSIQLWDGNGTARFLLYRKRADGRTWQHSFASLQSRLTATPAAGITSLRRSCGNGAGGLLQVTENEALTAVLHYKQSDGGPRLLRDEPDSSASIPRLLRSPRHKDSLV
ncbi:hypothetical protein J1614_011958 [Plenodomus biglobosus]|nr:hypothetical protein J1614_011958 [Plenodomus biglobosus]